MFRRAARGVEFLVLRRSTGQVLADTWQAVHGKIEPGETAVQAALRELREETGLAPAAFWQIDALNAFYVARTDEVHLCPCFAVEVAPDARVALSAEHTAFEWLGVQAAMERLMWPGQRRAVREVVEFIVPGSAAEPYLRLPCE